MKKICFSISLLSLIFLFSCDDGGSEVIGGNGGDGNGGNNGGGNNGGGTVTFNRGTMLANWADSIIIPAYQDFSNSLTELESATTEFTSTPNGTNLTALQDAWEASYIKWQRVSMFEIGKAEEILFRSYINIFPTNASLIESNISSGTYNLELPSNRTAQGFPALDYLLFGLGDNNAEVLAFYSTDANATNYKNYLSDLVSRMQSLTTIVLNNWETTYRDEFVENTGSSANASVDRFTNDFMFYYEKAFRAGKVGIPAGVFSSSGTLPDRVEGLYNRDISKTLFLEALDACQDFFNGKSYYTQTDSTGLGDYLKAIHDVNGGENLDSLINVQFDASRAKANQLQDDFYNQVETNNTLMLQTYDELQKNTIQLKVKMMQTLNISIDYVDADGD